jgi:hypothetical protein
MATTVSPSACSLVCRIQVCAAFKCVLHSSIAFWCCIPGLQRGKLEMEQLFREVVPEPNRYGTQVGEGHTQGARTGWLGSWHGGIMHRATARSSTRSRSAPPSPPPVCVPPGESSGPRSAAPGGCSGRTSHHCFWGLQVGGRVAFVGGWEDGRVGGWMGVNGRRARWAWCQLRHLRACAPAASPLIAD